MILSLKEKLGVIKLAEQGMPQADKGRKTRPHVAVPSKVLKPKARVLEEIMFIFVYVAINFFFTLQAFAGDSVCVSLCVYVRVCECVCTYIRFSAFKLQL